MDSSCPNCGFKYGWDGAACAHCRQPPSAFPAPPAEPPRTLSRTTKIVLAVGIVAVLAWFCWPGRFSTFNIWLVRPGMTLERVRWLLGSRGEEVAAAPIRQDLRSVVSGERFFCWYADPNGWWQGDCLYVGFAGGVVTGTYYWEEPLS